MTLSFCTKFLLSHDFFNFIFILDSFLHLGVLSNFCYAVGRPSQTRRRVCVKTTQKKILFFFDEFEF